MRSGDCAPRNDYPIRFSITPMLVSAETGFASLEDTEVRLFANITGDSAG
jgi:hypothetical protein